ncbi:MAG TPA: SusC/RagA family TonB-linked outer membrane protein [Puia sp.]|nr:SusC/RagA family TonB-linked outer membrane protein [Puia sp.]
MRNHLLSLILLCALSATAQEKLINGRVTDEKNEPIPFASIKIKNARSGIAADATGNFAIRVKSGDILVFSGTGLSPTEIPVGQDNFINVHLHRSGASLSEIIVTGYGSKSKRSSSGAADIVAIEPLRTQPIASFDQLLQGQATGVSVKTGSGQPGAAADIVIRGRGSLSGSTNPLYIVDGVEINAADFATLNQGDFESVTVLKDASSASIYGSRAAGGVIVITSRKGKVGPTKFSYDGQYGVSHWPRSRLKLMNTEEKLGYEKVNGNPNGWTDAEFDSLGQIHTDWEKVFFRTGITQSHQFSASGGNDKTRFYGSLSYLDQTGVVKTTGLKRYTGRLNIESGTNDFRFGLNTSFGYSEFTNTAENNQSIASPLNAIRWSLPYFTPYDKSGNYLQDPTPSGQPNPLQELLENHTSFPQWKGVANAFMEYRLPAVKGLMLRTNWGFDYTQNEQNIFNNKTTYAGSLAQGGEGSLLRQFDRNFRSVGTNSISYKTSFSDKHDLSVAVYQEIVQTSYRKFDFTGFGLTLPFQNEASITAGTPTNGLIPIVDGSGTKSALISYFTEANYGFENKYFLNAGYRRDGSSRFGVNNKWANFYQVGGSWILSDEDFASGLKKTFDLLKLKASYGTVGNQSGIADFGSRPLFNKATYAGLTGLRLNSPGNPDLRWETRSSFNAGIEFAMLKNRISGSVDYYNSITSDLLFQQTLSQTTGFANVLSNDGKLRNRGIELSLKFIPVRTNDFTWTIDGNFSYNRNVVLALPAGQDNVLNADGVSVLKVGKPANTFYMVRYAGVDPANGDPLYFTKDGKTKTNVYSTDDKVYEGTSDAPYFGGITNSFKYKGLELQIFWIYTIGNVIYNNDRLNVENPGYTASSLSADLLREWRKPGDITDIPRADPSVYELGNTTHFVESGNFWRLRNVMLSYTFTPAVLQKLNISALRLFVQGQNLYTATKYRGYDPEIPGAGGTLIGGAQYPTLKTVTAGLNLSF